MSAPGATEDRPVSFVVGRRRVTVRRVWRWVLRAAMVAAVAVAVLGWPTSAGGRTSYSIVSGHSMNPTYHTGDLVVLQSQHSYRVGQIVVYKIPAGEPASGQFVVHRIIGGDNPHGFVTKGDNNPSVDIWTPHNIDIRGAAVMLVPQVGWVLRQGRDPLLYALLGALYFGRLLWPSKTADPADPAGSDPAEPRPRRRRWLRRRVADQR